MQLRPIGTTGLSVSELGFGCGAVGGLMVRGRPEEQRAAITRALDAGITYFDTAQMYGNGASEENLGRTLSELGAWDRVVVGTKLIVPGEQMKDARESVIRSLQISLKRLRRDSIDLIQLHGRVLTGSGGDGPSAREVREIIADALYGAVAAGLVRHVGFTGLGDSAAVIEVVRSGNFETVQAYFNALNPSAGFGGLIDIAAAAGVGVINIRVLAAGAISGSSNRAPNAVERIDAPMTLGGEFGADLGRAQALAPLARELGIATTTELGFRFALAKPGISTVLIGFSDGGQLEEALGWVEKGPLPPEAIDKVLAIAR
jgi:L-galactose dehydrogenase/L-glyceraldehyde 3-phosphate reductase